MDLEVETLSCPEKECKFTYSDKDPNALKVHKSKDHRQFVNVSYTNPPEETNIVRTDDIFQCKRCNYSTNYPSSLQVSLYII
jgi:hypothetical protein